MAQKRKLQDKYFKMAKREGVAGFFKGISSAAGQDHGRPLSFARLR